MPVFVKIEKHRDITTNIGTIGSKISVARKTLERVKELKKQEDNEISAWETKLNGIEEKMRFLEEAMKQE